MKGSETDSNGKKPWGKLTSFTARIENVNLIEDSYTIGRNQTNTIQIADIRLSGNHCKVFKDSDDKCWIEDLSSNGTFIENGNIGKGNKKELVSGDKIYLLHQSKVKMEDTLGYVFSSMIEDNAKLKKQREEDQKAILEEKKQTEKAIKFQEDLGEEMKCCICIDYIYRCVTLMPCLHNFCSSCFSDWMMKSQMCPQCREEAIELKKNATVNNIIEKFMENNPDKKRPKEEYEEMDAKDKIKEDRINIKNFLKKPAPVASPYMGGGMMMGGGGLFGSPFVQVQPTNFVAATVQRNRGRGRGRGGYY